MSFLKSAINQVGRDMGKVVSNQIFKDSHSTPYRRVGNSNVVVTQNSNYSSKKVSKTEFDKAIEFQVEKAVEKFAEKAAETAAEKATEDLDIGDF